MNFTAINEHIHFKISLMCVQVGLNKTNTCNIRLGYRKTVEFFQQGEKRQEKCGLRAVQAAEKDAFTAK